MTSPLRPFRLRRVPRERTRNGRTPAWAGALAIAIVAGALSFASPALAVNGPLTATFTDLCGFVEVAIANPTAAPVSFQLFRSGKPLVTGSVPGNATVTTQQVVNDGDEVRLLDQSAPIHTYHPPLGCQAPALHGEIVAGCGRQITAVIVSDHAASDKVSFKVGTTIVAANQTIGADQKVLLNATGPAIPFEASVFRETPDGSFSVVFSSTYTAEPSGCGPGSLTAAFTDHCGGSFDTVVTNTASGFQYVSVVHNNAVVKTFQLGPKLLTGPFTAMTTLPATNGDVFLVLRSNDANSGLVVGVHTYHTPANCGGAPPGGGALPVTGPAGLLATGVGLAVLLAGAMLVLLTRRRRTHFTP
ncbi:MAG TPA: hypothetical protein VFE14_19515 [Micromonosporaceae bacterium]|nr:hypothetical protein [Micromonosporaceae bacterium]